MNSLLPIIVVLLSWVTLAHSQQTLLEVAPGRGTVLETKAATFDLKFNGGTVEDLLNAIAGQIGRRPNVIIPEPLKGASFPSFEVVDVNLSGLFEALGLATDYAFESTTAPDSSDERRIWVLKGPVKPNLVTKTTSNEGLWFSDLQSGTTADPGFFAPKSPKPNRDPLSANLASQNKDNSSSLNRAVEWIQGDLSSTAAAPNPTTPEKAKTKTQPLGIGELMDVFKLEDITTAILQTWESADKEHRGRIAFHTDANLLILTATPEQIELANAVLEELSAEAQRRPRDPSSKPSN